MYLYAFRIKFMHINVKRKLYNNELHIYVIQVEERFKTRITSL